jgi:hypothetical protein
MKHLHRRNRNVRSIGYLDKKSTLDAIEQEERMSYVNGTMRVSDLQEVQKFVNLFKQGDVLKVTLRRRSFQGTLLGYRRHERRGWVMGILESRPGTVKDVTIDPKGYESILDDILEIMVDSKSRYISLVTPYEAILQITPLEKMTA